MPPENGPSVSIAAADAFSIAGNYLGRAEVLSVMRWVYVVSNVQTCNLQKLETKSESNEQSPNQPEREELPIIIRYVQLIGPKLFRSISLPNTHTGYWLLYTVSEWAVWSPRFLAGNRGVNFEREKKEKKDVGICGWRKGSWATNSSNSNWFANDHRLSIHDMLHRFFCFIR